MRHLEVRDFVQAALECSVYHSPRKVGLTLKELLEVGTRAGYQRGEIHDALRAKVWPTSRSGRLLKPDRRVQWGLFIDREDPDHRNVAAFDFVHSALVAEAQEHGASAARLDRDVLVARGEAAGIDRNDVEVAITILALEAHLIEENSTVRFAPGRHTYRLPSSQFAKLQTHTVPAPLRAKAYPIVEDVIARRSDGRPNSAEPLDSFRDRLGGLGYGQFQRWWVQIVAELRHADPGTSPTTATVLAAALVEGALTFVVKHARASGLRVLGSKDFERPENTWKIEDLVKSAAHGKESAILDERTRARAMDLVRNRQRIHAGGMLVSYPNGVPDLRPEEARDAKATADAVVRSVCDWLEKHPVSVR